MPKVSVIIPTWNRGYIIEKTIQSVLNQTMSDLEVLVCDDGSTDDTFEIVKKINDPRIRLVTGVRGGRPAIPRNNGIREAKGGWLAFLDSDDEWLPEKLEKQLAMMAKEKTLAASSNAKRLIPDQGIVGNYLQLEKNRITFDDLLKTNEIITSSAIIHRDLVEKALGFPEEEELRTIEDYAFWLRIAMQTDFAFSAEPLVIYRDDMKNSIRGEEAADTLLQRKIVFGDFISWGKKQDGVEKYVDLINEQYENAIALRLIRLGKIDFGNVNEELAYLRNELKRIKESKSFKLGFVMLHPVEEFFLKRKKIKSCPKVSVLMPVYNGEKYLRKAIESILNQNYGNFELIIINDGSTDYTKDIILSYADGRIKYVENEKNIGLIGTLNKGLQLAIGKYIARMDCDDISLPDRLRKQVQFMEENEHVCICGAWIRFIGNAEDRVVKYPVRHEDIKCKMLFSNPIAHPTAMMRVEFLRNNNLKYEDFKYAEDYELWSRCIKKCQMHNIPEVLLEYRITPTSITHSKGQELKETVKKIFAKMVHEMNLDFDEDMFWVHRAIGDEISLKEISEIRRVRKYLHCLMEANDKTKLFPQKEFRKTLSDYWYIMCAKYEGKFGEAFLEYIRSPFKKRPIIFYRLLKYYKRLFKAYCKGILKAVVRKYKPKKK